MKNTLCLILISLLSVACAQTVDLRASHFAVPVVPQSDFTLQVHGSMTSNTSVTLIQDYTANPPVEGEVGFNEDIDVVDLVLPGFKNIGLDASLSFKYGFEAFLHGSKLGLRWQFLNHGAGPNRWVAAIHASSGGLSQTSSQESGGNESKAETTVDSSQVGISLGYTLADFTPYFSYIKENHSATTDVTNVGGTFGPYKDKGEHQYYSLGITSPLAKGFVYTIEVNGIQMKWQDPDVDGWQTATGIRLGYSW